MVNCVGANSHKAAVCFALLLAQSGKFCGERNPPARSARKMKVSPFLSRTRAGLNLGRSAFRNHCQHQCHPFIQRVWGQIPPCAAVDRGTKGLQLLPPIRWGYWGLVQSLAQARSALKATLNGTPPSMAFMGHCRAAELCGSHQFLSRQCYTQPRILPAKGTCLELAQSQLCHTEQISFACASHWSWSGGLYSCLISHLGPA